MRLMQAVQLHKHGGTDVLQLEEIPRPEPGDGDVLIEVDTAGVNPIDTYFREGSFPPVSLPFIPGVDCAGIVVETGAHVERFEDGDRVCATGIGNGNHQGAYAEYVTVPDDRVVAVPDGVSLKQAGAVGAVGATAWRALITYANLAPTEYCLVHGGSGGVGHVAVQIARAVGARVFTTARPAYHDTLEEFGAEAAFDYRRDDLAEAIIDASGGGVDVILDHRLDEYLQFDADVARTQGRIVGIGDTSSGSCFENNRTTRAKDLNYQFMSVFNSPDLRIPLRRAMALMEMEKLTVSVAQSYGLDAAATAQRTVATESFLGKLVVRP